MFKVLHSGDILGITVETDEDKYKNYIRYGADCWFVSMGESSEPVYDCEELELAYQQHIKG